METDVFHPSRITFGKVRKDFAVPGYESRLIDVFVDGNTAGQLYRARHWVYCDSVEPIWDNSRGTSCMFFLKDIRGYVSIDTRGWWFPKNATQAKAAARAKLAEAINEHITKRRRVKLQRLTNRAKAIACILKHADQLVDLCGGVRAAVKKRQDVDSAMAPVCDKVDDIRREVNWYIENAEKDV